MYTLILIVSLVANGAAVDIEHISFSNKSDCQEALIEILRDNKDTSLVAETFGAGRQYVKAYCVKNNSLIEVLR